MLVAIINHNLPSLTDSLVKSLKNDQTDYELLVLDNGSNLEKPSKYTTHTLSSNVFFGGGVDVILDYFLKSNHSHVYILNNDLIVHNNFIANSLSTAVSEDLSLYSPSIINASIEQCHWKQMLSHGTRDIRPVDWVDWQAPLLRRDLVELIYPIPKKLYYGWGIDFHSGIKAKEAELKIAVDDGNTITHLNSQTFKQDKINIGVDEFCRIAEANMNDYFRTSHTLYKEYIKFREYGENYKIW